MDAAIVFVDRWDERASGALANRVSVQGEFPAQFRIEVNAPPPPRPNNPTLSDTLPPEIGLGFVAAVAADSGNVIQPREIQGVSVDTGILYFAVDGNADDPADPVSYLAKKASVPATRGYHLFRQTVTKEQESAYIVCTAAGLCDHRVLGESDLYGDHQRTKDRLFDECRALLADAPTCTYYSHPANDAENQEALRCFDLIVARDARAPSDCPIRVTLPENPQGLDLPITVTLGTTMEDWLFPSPPE
jgi:hypothetical protein